MKAKATWMALVLASLALAAAEPKAEEAAAPDAGIVGPGKTVPMVELTLSGRTIEGRLVFEDDQIIRIEPIGSGTIGYALNTVRDARRFSLSASAFEERYGDYYQGRAWTAADPPAEYARARQAYERALIVADSEADRTRIQAKLDTLTADREAWQQEALRLQDLELARHQVDLLVLEKQLTRQKLDALEQQARELQALKVVIQRIQIDGQALADAVEDLHADLVELADDVDDLQARDNAYIRTETFAALRRDHDQLDRQVQRISQGTGIR